MPALECRIRVPRRFENRNRLAAWRSLWWKRREFVGFQVRCQGGVEGLDGIMAAFFQREEDARQDGLDVGTFDAPIAVAVLADDDGGANGLLGHFFRRGLRFVIQEREQFEAMAAQAFDQFVEPRRQSFSLRGAGLRRQFVAQTPQHARHRVVSGPRVAHPNAAEFLREELQQRRMSARAVDQKVAQIGVGEAPQPVRFAVHSPATFVGVRVTKFQI